MAVIRIIFILIFLFATDTIQAGCDLQTAGNSTQVEALDSASAVNEIQQNLTDIGLLTDSSDNDAQAALSEAVKKYQKKTYAR